MFIDEHFSEIIDQLSYDPDTEEMELLKPLFIDKLDGISAVSISGLYDTNKKSGSWSVNFPSERLWFEEIREHITYGVLYTRLTDDMKGRQKEVLRHVKKVKQGKLFGYFTKRKPSFVGITSVELLRMIVSDENNPVMFFGMVMRLVTDERICKDFVIATEPNSTYSDFAFKVLIKVLEAQRTINNSKIVKTISNETARLHLPNSDKSVDFEHKIVTVKPGTTEVVLRQPNPKGGGWKLHKHKRPGYTCKRRYHTKNGVVTKTVNIPDYWAGHGDKTVHKDYKL